MAIQEANAVFSPIRFGPYELLAKLAVGGMAEIFLAREAESENDEELFVVKRLLPHIAQHPDLVQMFIDEVRVAATLQHENVVRVFNVGAIGDKYFQSMEYLTGVDLRRICQVFWSQRKQIPLEIVLSVLIGVSEGLAYVHSRTDGSGRPLKLIHRDISPHNIFVTADGLSKILDFGVAKAANALHQTRTGALVGKLSYMSPEQAKTHNLDSRSDIFSLGIMMWELFAGRRLFRVKELGEFEVLRRLCEEEIPPPSRFSNGPKDIDRIVARALMKDRERRYQGGEHLARDLRTVAEKFGIDASVRTTGSMFRRIFARELEAEAVNIGRLGALPTSTIDEEGRQVASEAISRPQAPPPRPVQAAPSSGTASDTSGPKGRSYISQVASSQGSGDDDLSNPFPDMERTSRVTREEKSGGSGRIARRASVRIPVSEAAQLLAQTPKSKPPSVWGKLAKDSPIIILVGALLLGIGVLIAVLVGS